MSAGKNTAQEAIEVIQAHLDGKCIRVSIIGSHQAFVEVEEPTWNFASFRYEIMPEPRTIYVNEYGVKGLLGNCHFSKEEEAIRCANGSDAYARTLEFTEVIK